jgi:hypothetical protein
MCVYDAKHSTVSCTKHVHAIADEDIKHITVSSSKYFLIFIIITNAEILQIIYKRFTECCF